MQSRIRLYPLLGVLLLMVGCSEITGSGGAGLALGLGKVEISGGQTASFTGAASSVEISSQNQHQISIGSTDGRHVVGVHTYSGSFQVGTYSLDGATATGVYGFSTESAVEGYESTGGTLTISEVTSTGIRGSLSFSAAQSGGTKTVSVQARFFAQIQ